MTHDGTSIRVRIDHEGYTYITVTQRDARMKSFSVRSRNFEANFSLAHRGSGDCHGKSD
jgi:hypothetical protein